MASGGNRPPSKRHKSEPDQQCGFNAMERPSSPKLVQQEVNRPPSPKPESTSQTRPPSPKPGSTSQFRPPSPKPVLALLRPSSPTCAGPSAQEDFKNNETETDFLPLNLDAWSEQPDQVKEEDVDEEYLKDFFLDKGERPLYDGAKITLNESLVSVLTYSIKYSLSGQAIGALLKLLKLHCPRENNVLTPSLYLFKKYFSHIQSEVHYQYFCSKCLTECPGKKCQNSKCEGKAPLCYLISMPLIKSLEKLLQREDFYKKLQFPHPRPNTSECEYADVTDGAVYKEATKDTHPSVLSITAEWYTDGAALFDSAKLSAWPLMLSINELPYKDRHKKENILIPALWCGTVKPHGNFLLEPILSEVLQLRESVEMEVFGEGRKNVKLTVISGCGDTPARGLMLNTTAHNGEYACHRCYQPGECREQHFGVRVFPYNPSEMRERSNNEFQEDGEIACKLKFSNSYMGLKGPTLLSAICPDAVRGTSIDAMHLLYGGVMKTLTKFFVAQEYRSLPCNVYSKFAPLIDERLLNIKLPSYLTRTPKPTSDLAVWKTSFWKTWTLYISLPVLEDVLPPMNYKHFASLVAAVRFLNAEIVREKGISDANLLIHKVMDFFEDLYGREFMTLNFHLLLHLCQMVQDLGPLWVTACFPQESVNGDIMKLVHGSRYPETQIALSLNLILGLSEIVRNLPHGQPKLYCEEVLRRTQSEKTTDAKDCSIIGKTTLQVIPSEFIEEATKNGFSANETVLNFKSIRQEKILYTVDKVKSGRDDSAVVLCNGELGLLKCMFKKNCQCSECNCEVFVGIQSYEKKSQIPTLIEDVFVPGMHKCILSNNFKLLRSKYLYDVCVKVPVEKKLFIVQRCNRLEME